MYSRQKCRNDSFYVKREYECTGSLNRAETECIDQLEKLLMEEGRGSYLYRNWIINCLSSKLDNILQSIVAADDSSDSSSNSFHTAGRSFLNTLDRFLELCYTVRKLHLISNAENEEPLKRKTP